MDNNKKFTWLQISDLHVGIAQQNWLWPSLKHEFFEDIKRLLNKIPSLDVVIFSGDLTQTGSKNEYEKLSEILEELWSKFREYGSDPKLFVVPGNHDLARPDSFDSEVIAIKQYWQDPQVSKAIWNDKNPKLLEKINSSFKNYEEWREKVQNKIPCLEIKYGKVIGDTSAQFEINSLKIGLVGINSTWLQLQDGNYKGKLCIHPEQILSVTDNDPTNWCNKNDFNILVTHHPESWLHLENQKTFKSEINQSNRFIAHLFGHMHEPNIYTLSQGGGAPKRSIQAASLFGLENYSESFNRIHGYSIGQILLENNSKIFRLWPRRDNIKASGIRKLNADMHFELNEENYLQEIIQEKPSNYPSLATFVANSSAVTMDTDKQNVEILSRIKIFLPPAKEHLESRQIEQNLCITCLNENKKAWIVAEWGMASDAFLWSVLQKANDGKSSVYKIDLSSYKNRLEFFDTFNTQIGCSFTQLCSAFSGEEVEYLILDDIPIGEDPELANSLELDIMDMSTTIMQYCPKLNIIFRSRRMPTFDSAKIELKAFDELETKNYVLSHQLGGKSLTDYETINQIFINTDGVPAQIDITLKQLQVTSLSDLSKSNSDLVISKSALALTSHALMRAISELEKSKDPSLSRSFELLKALSIFPQGELLDRIKRFNGSDGFYPANATELLDRGLIDSITQLNVGSIGNGELSKTLIVKRPVREYINSSVSKSEFSKINKKALNMFFGNNWPLKIFKPNPSYKFDRPGRSPAEISNVGIAILRFMNEAINPESETKITVGLSLAKHFSTALLKGGYYRGLINFVSDIIALIPQDKYIEYLNGFKTDLAESLRMVKEAEKAKEILLDIQNWSTSNSTKQNIYLDLALTFTSLDEKEIAVEYATKAKKINAKNSQGLQAQSIILNSLSDENPEKNISLLKHENLARKNKSSVVANNMALTRALETNDPLKKREILLDVLKLATSENDLYNATRAIVRLGILASTSELKLTLNEQKQLISSYHYLYDQKLDNLFNSCHKGLWSLFEMNNDVPNLLKLFRHSSFIWRLRGLETEELKYALKLNDFLKEKEFIEDLSIKKETAYFRFRITIVNA